MVGLLSFLWCVDIVVFMVAVVFLFIRVIKKQPKKIFVITITTTFITFFALTMWISNIYTPIKKPESQNKSESESKTSSTSSSSSDMGSTSNIVKSETSNPKTESEVSSNQSNPDDSKKAPNQETLDNFFIEIGTNVKMDEIEEIAKSNGLFIYGRNYGVGAYLYRITTEYKAIGADDREKGSCVTVLFDGLKNDMITEITYFDENRMIAGYWSPVLGYAVVDYNHPQIVYREEGKEKIYSSQIPVNDAKDIIQYSLVEDPGENLLEILFSSITPEMTIEDLLSFVDTHELNYNSSGVGNHNIISYAYNIGAKYGENGSYITFSSENGLITQMTYLYYPLNYRSGYAISYYADTYAECYSTPSGFVLECRDGFVKYSSAEELLAGLHDLI